RWTVIVPGGDSGWRMMYQYMPDRGPFNREKIWQPYHAETPAYIIPPIANFADGPSGLVAYPGTGLDDSFRGTFFLCDFRGQASNSGVRTAKVKARGASFELVEMAEPIWTILATDIDFGPD
ncbi:MAG: glucose dehydrogenase, partial [Pirellulaceae bacterium]